MRVLLKLIFKEIDSRRGWTVVFILSLSLGLSALSTLELLRTSFQQQFENTARDLFGCDLKISSLDPLSEYLETILKEELPQGSQTTRKTSFDTMVKFGEGFQLVRVHGVEPAWPLYGQFEAEGYTGENWREEFFDSPSVIVDPQLATILYLHSIQFLKIGRVQFKVLGVARKSTNVANINIKISPELFIARKFLKNTGLLEMNSRAVYECVIKLPPNTLSTVDQGDLRSKLDVTQKGKRRLRMVDLDKDVSRVNEALKWFKKYLGLIGMIALLLSVCGTSVLHATFLKSKIPEIAILRVQGLSRTKTYLIQILKLALLGAIASIFAVLLSFAMIELISQILVGLFPANLEIRLSLIYFLTILIPGISGAVIPCLPALRYLRDIKLSGLLSGNNLKVKENVGRDWFLVISLLVVVIWIYLLSSFQAGSFKYGLIFTLCVLGASLILIFVGKLWMKSASGGFYKGRFNLSFTILDLSRTPTTSLVSLTSIGLSVLMICILPQVESNLRSIIFSRSSKIPDFFLFEILPEQVVELQNFCKAEGIQLTAPVPMIRSELTKVNSLDLIHYLDRPNGPGSATGFGEMLLRRGANLTYQEDDQPSSSSKIVEGKMGFSSNSDMPEISLERRFAEKLKLSINDVLEFDIQGLPYKGRVINLREVRWNSYEPNFFIQGAKKDLQDYPASFLATITANANTDRFKIHLKLLENFPNFSSVDLQATLRQVLDVLSKLAFGIYFLALITLICGFVVLFSITHFEVNSDAWKWNLLRVLGASPARLRTLVMLRCFLISGSASLTAFFLSYPISYILWSGLFRNIEIEFQLRNPLILTIMIPIFTMIIGYLVSLGISRQKPATLFSSV